MAKKRSDPNSLTLEEYMHYLSLEMKFEDVKSTISLDELAKFYEKDQGKTEKPPALDLSEFLLIQQPSIASVGDTDLSLQELPDVGAMNFDFNEIFNEKESEEFVNPFENESEIVLLSKEIIEVLRENNPTQEEVNAYNKYTNNNLSIVSGEPFTPLTPEEEKDCLSYLRKGEQLTKLDISERTLILGELSKFKEEMRKREMREKLADPNSLSQSGSFKRKRPRIS